MSLLVPVERFDASSISVIPSSFRVSSPYVAPAILIRLLTGTINIENTSNHKIFCQKNDFTNMTASHRLQKTTVKLMSLFRDYPNAASSINRIRNHDIFDEILVEYLHFFYYEKIKLHMPAFVHLYRIVERLSFLVPLIWIHKSNDYLKAFSDLREYMNGTATGELRFFRRFIKDSIDSTFYDYHCRLIIPTSVNQAYYYSLLNSMYDTSDFISNRPNSEITIKQGGVINLIINVRNKFFHASVGNPNNVEIKKFDDNEFFAILNHSSCEIISYIILESLKSNL